MPQLNRWGELQEMIADEDILPGEVDDFFAKALKVSQVDGALDQKGFIALTEMIDELFAKLNPDQLDSVTLGGFRLPKTFYKKIRKLHPDNKLFHAGLSENQGQWNYEQEIENQILSQVKKHTQQYINQDKIFSYSSYSIDN